MLLSAVHLVDWGLLSMRYQMIHPTILRVAEAVPVQGHQDQVVGQALLAVEVLPVEAGMTVVVDGMVDRCNYGQCYEE